MTTADLDTHDAQPGTVAGARQSAGSLAELTDVVARFTALISRRLPDDVTARLKELAEE